MAEVSCERFDLLHRVFRCAYGRSYAAGFSSSQSRGPFGPFGAIFAFNTAASFVSNTNWRSYSGESTLSYFSQAIGLTVQNFVTPAVGMAVLFALFRGLVAQNSEGLGSFFGRMSCARCSAC